MAVTSPESACQAHARAARRRSTRPLFDIDPGWLFIIAGLALCVAGVLIPAQKDLHELRMQLETLREQERLGSERLRQHARFLADLDDADPSLIRRLAASQLNLLPVGDTPVILASNDRAALTDWVDARAALAMNDSPPEQSLWPDTTLTQLATGPQRLWLLGGGVFAVFIGVIVGPARLALTRKPPLEADSEAMADQPEPIELETEPAEVEDSVEGFDESTDDDPSELLCEIITASEFAIDADEDELLDAGEAVASVEGRSAAR